MTTTLVCFAVALLAYEAGRLRGIQEAARVVADGQVACRAATKSLEAALQAEASLDSFYVDSDGEDAGKHEAIAAS